jgi:hypothetical protein
MEIGISISPSLIVYIGILISGTPVYNETGVSVYLNNAAASGDFGAILLTEF